MQPDAILREVYAAREKLAASCDDDLDKLFAMIKRLEARHPSRLVCPPRRPASPVASTPATSVAETPGNYAGTGAEGRTDWRANGEDAPRPAAPG